jgi:signal transduction histidine kinase
MCARTVHVDVNATDVTAEVDPVQIERIVDNLLSNADKYTPPESLIHVIVDGDDDTVRISVIDDGPGIAECDLERVFEPFDRSSVTPGQPGSGVGLFLVRQFAAFHGGDARCERLDGGGTRFVVTLARRSPAVLKG